jgi:hypothetical protein
MKRISAAVLAVSVALSGLAYAHGGEPHIRGTVVSATASALIVKTKTGTQTLIVDASTKVLRGKKKAALADVKAGDRVVVHPMKHGEHLMAEEINLATASPKKTQ